MDVAEFGVGHGNNIKLLSNFVMSIDGYDGSSLSINKLMELKKSIPNINGKQVNLVNYFDVLKKYDVIIFGFFTYLISDTEFKNMILNLKYYLKPKSYIYI